MKRLKYKNGPLDAIDIKLLKALTNDARASVTDLARLVQLSAPSVSERLKRLEEAGVIVGYSVNINPEAFDLPLAVFLRIRPIPGEHNRVAKILQAMPNIVECDRVTGEDCFVAKAHVPSVKALEELVDEIIPYAMTNTSIIQSYNHTIIQSYNHHP
ncbi:Lrp/AsnC family transcriptional regulator [Kiloniella sp.]|uniref:Lrp/AsnC family transcriptional regulator n=1 Tax=Kiloniella sp. TaxID=1938587 RepID=UPI003B0264F9